jgi:hypothetical protein
MMHFLALSPDAAAYYEGLEQRRFNARQHVRKILALADIYPADTVARAISDGLAFGRNRRARMDFLRLAPERPLDLMRLAPGSTPRTSQREHERGQGGKARRGPIPTSCRSAFLCNSAAPRSATNVEEH